MCSINKEIGGETMKKKLLGLGLAVMMVVGAAMTSFAAQSPSYPGENTQPTKPDTTAKAVVNGQEVEFVTSWYWDYDKLTSNEKLAIAAFNDLYTSTLSAKRNIEVDAVEKAYVEKYGEMSTWTEATWDAYDKEIQAINTKYNTEAYAGFVGGVAGKTITAVYDYDYLSIENPGNVDLSAGVDITFETPALESMAKDFGGEFVVLHFSDKENKWEYLESTYKDGKLTAKFTSLSPVYVFKADVAKEDATKSPKTGAASVAIFGLGAAGAALITKKFHF